MIMKPASDMPAIRLVMMPKDTNAQGTIFGGVLLSLIDQAAFVEAWRQARLRYVTVAMDRVEFHQPVHVGDILSLWAETTKVGRTSLRVHVDVFAMGREAEARVKVTEAEVVLVAVDEAGRPVPLQSDA